MSGVGYRGALSIFVQIRSRYVHVIVDRRRVGDLVVVVYEILCCGRLDKLPILDDVFNLYCPVFATLFTLMMNSSVSFLIDIIRGSMGWLKS